jgi:hypothetical protein
MNRDLSTGSPYSQTGAAVANPDMTGGGGEAGPQAGGYPRTYPTTGMASGTAAATPTDNASASFVGNSAPATSENGYRPGSTGRSVTAGGVLGTPPNVQAGYQAPMANEEAVPEYDPMGNPGEAAPVSNYPGNGYPSSGYPSGNPQNSGYPNTAPQSSGYPNGSAPTAGAPSGGGSFGGNSFGGNAYGGNSFIPPSGM